MELSGLSINFPTIGYNFSVTYLFLYRLIRNRLYLLKSFAKDLSCFSVISKRGEGELCLSEECSVAAEGLYKLESILIGLRERSSNLEVFEKVGASKVFLLTCFIDSLLFLNQSFAV